MEMPVIIIFTKNDQHDAAFSSNVKTVREKNHVPKNTRRRLG